MPPELHATYRRPLGEVIFCLVFTVIWLMIAPWCHAAVITDNPGYYEASLPLKIFALIYIDGTLIFFALFGIYGTIHTYYYRLIFDENGITEKGIWLAKTIRVPEITMIKWSGNGYRRIKLRTPTTRMTLSHDNMRRDSERKKLFIDFLRETVPMEHQQGWEEFRGW